MSGIEYLLEGLGFTEITVVHHQGGSGRLQWGGLAAGITRIAGLDLLDQGWQI